METPGLIPYQKISSIIEHVDTARADVQQAFALLLSAKERLAAVLGDGVAQYSAHLWDHNISDYHLAGTAQDVDARIARNAWNYIITQTGLRHYLTERRQQELHRQLESNELPPLTVANVYSTLEGFTTQLGALLDESIQEVFTWLRPRHQHGTGALKTNQRFRVGYKVILVNAVECAWHGGFQLNHYIAPNLRTLGNVLSLLDGQGVQRYPDDLCTQLSQALQGCEPGQPFTVPYLQGKPYGNSNLHLAFSRPDLIDQLNQRGGDGTIPPPTP